MSRKDQRKIIILGLVCGAMQMVRGAGGMPRNDVKTTHRIENQCNRLLDRYPPHERLSPTLVRKIYDSIHGIEMACKGSVPTAALITCCLDCVERERDFHPKDATWRNLAGSLFTLLTHFYDGWMDPHDGLCIAGMGLANVVRGRI
jgi:hypothetical protein